MSSKITKKRLTLCKDKSEKILNILNEKKTQADVTEFIHTLKFVINALDNFVSTKDKERPIVSDEGARIEQLLKEYEDLLNQLVESGRFVRFFTSNRVRKRLDQINSQLFKESLPIHNGLQSSTKKKSKKKGEPELDNYVDCCSDPDGREVWSSNCGNALMVEWKDFVSAVNKVVPIDEETNGLLQYVLDNSNTGYISIFKFSDFLTGFGPFKQFVQKLHQILKSDYFHGFLSSGEAERLLEKQAVGTFLIRFSKSKPGSFAIAYVDANNRNNVTHTLITSSQNGFKIDEQYNPNNARGRLFANLNEVVDFYNYILSTPFKSDLSKQNWFHGDLSSAEAEELLKSERDGTFLFRFSSKSGFLAISYVQQGNVRHGLLEASPNGYKFDSNPPCYPTLQDVVDNLKEFLTYPYTNLSFQQGKRPNISIASLSKATSTNSLTASTSGGSNDNYASFSGLFNKSPSSITMSNSGGINNNNNNNNNNNGSGTLYSTLNGVRPASPGGGVTPLRGTLSANQTAETTSEYVGIPARNPLTNSGTFVRPSSSLPTTSPINQYGTMPVPNNTTGTNNYSGLPGTTPPTTASPSTASMGQYGRMPIASPHITGTTNNNSNSSNVSNGYGSIPGASQSPLQPTQQRTNSSTNIGNNPVASPGAASMGQYGRMPNPIDRSNNNNNTLNSPQPTVVPGNNYGSLPTSPITSNTLTPQQQQYGKMPTPTNREIDIQAASVSPDGNYVLLSNKLPLNSTPVNQYGKMPTPGSQSTSTLNNNNNNASSLNSNYGNFSPLGKPIGTTTAPSSNYATIPLNQPKNNNTVNSPGNNYGSLAAFSNNTNTPPKTAVQYSSIPSPANKNSQQVNNNNNNNNNNHLRTSTYGEHKAPMDYGTIPAPTRSYQQPISGNNDYGALPPALGANDDYGSLKPLNLNSMSLGSNDEYGSLPPVNDSYGGLPSSNRSLPPMDEDNYGALPPTFQQQVPNQDNYGSLPPTEDSYGALPAFGGSDYGSLPPAYQNDNNPEYGALPPTGSPQNEPDYGALPNVLSSVSSPPKFAHIRPSNHRLNPSARLSFHRTGSQ